MIRLEKIERENYTIVSIELDENIAPAELKNINPPKVDGTKGVILTGRGSIWLYAYLVHYYHPTKFIATYDPRLGGAVVVESHAQDIEVGEIMEVSENGE